MDYDEEEEEKLVGKDEGVGYKRYLDSYRNSSDSLGFDFPTERNQVETLPTIEAKCNDFLI